jgi:hypothetical protein
MHHIGNGEHEISQKTPHAKAKVPTQPWQENENHGEDIRA